MNELQLIDLCNKIVSKAQGNGASASEVQVKSNRQVLADIELGQISSVSQGQSDQLAIRVFIEGRMGCAFTNILSENEAEEALRLALNSARVTTTDEEWRSLSKPSVYPDVAGIWDNEAASCEASKMVEMTVDILRVASEVEPGMIPVYGGTSAVVERNAYANSNGVSHSERGTAAYIILAAIAQTESGVTPMVTSFDISRGLDLNINETINDLASTVRICKKKVEGKKGKHTVIMHPAAYGSLLQYTLLQSIRGDNVARGKSMIADRIGDDIASSKITLNDDGLYPDAINTAISDDEGVPKQKTAIIDHGVLGSFLWDTYWANKMGVESTGNATRSLRQGLVEVTPNTITIEPGDRDVHDILSDIDYGYYIRDVQGAHSSNPESGDFSIVGNPAILVKDGELTGAIDGLMLSGNIFDLLKQVDEVAKKPIKLESIIAPEIAFTDVNVITRG
jgi:PmbA protein